MTELITARQFHADASIAEWRVLGDGACTYFRTRSFAESARGGRVEIPGDHIEPLGARHLRDARGDIDARGLDAPLRQGAERDAVVAAERDHRPAGELIPEPA